MRPRRDVPPIPPAFAITEEATRELSLRESAAIEALVKHTANVEDIRIVDWAVSCAVFAIREARKQHKSCALEVEALDAAEAQMMEHVRAILQVYDRHRTTGLIGCNAEQRESFRALADDMAECRKAIPRRIWLIAMRRASRNERVVVRS